MNRAPASFDLVALVESCRKRMGVLERSLGERVADYVVGLVDQLAGAEIALSPRRSAMLLRNVVADHEAKEAIVQQSGLDWTIARPPRLTNGPLTGAYRSGERIGANSTIPTISRADVADFMLKQLIDDANLRKAPGVMNG